MSQLGEEKVHGLTQHFQHFTDGIDMRNRIINYPKPPPSHDKPKLAHKQFDISLKAKALYNFTKFLSIITFGISVTALFIWVSLVVLIPLTPMAWIGINQEELSYRIHETPKQCFKGYSQECFEQMGTSLLELPKARKPISYKISVPSGKDYDKILVRIPTSFDYCWGLQCFTNNSEGSHTLAIPSSGEDLWIFTSKLTRMETFLAETEFLNPRQAYYLSSVLISKSLGLGQNPLAITSSPFSSAFLVLIGFNENVLSNSFVIRRMLMIFFATITLSVCIGAWAIAQTGRYNEDTTKGHPRVGKYGTMNHQSDKPQSSHETLMERTHHGNSR